MVTDLIKPGTSIEDAQDFCGYANVPMRLALANINVGRRRETDTVVGVTAPLSWACRVIGVGVGTGVGVVVVTWVLFISGGEYIRLLPFCSARASLTTLSANSPVKKTPEAVSFQNKQIRFYFY